MNGELGRIKEESVAIGHIFRTTEDSQSLDPSLSQTDLVLFMW
jgi:hypothetical protein